MTVKQIALLTAKPGMPRDAFIRRYEGGHVPLISRTIPFFDAYRRNFVIPDEGGASPHLASAPPSIGYDVLTELWFRDQAALDALHHAVTTTDARDRIDEDETHFFDRSRLMMTGVDEHRTPAARLAPRPSGHSGRPAIKFAIFVYRNPGQSREEFIDYYENRHAPLALQLFQRDGAPLFAEYARSYPIAEQCRLIGERSGSAPIPCDAITEYSFWTAQAREDFLALARRDEIAVPLAEDEARLADRSRFRVSRIEEHGSESVPA